jgi:hypothetical protein
MALEQQILTRRLQDLGTVSLNILRGKTGILSTGKRAPKPLVKRPPVCLKNCISYCKFYCQSQIVFKVQFTTERVFSDAVANI